MIRILAYTKTGELYQNISLSDINLLRSNLAWYWIDFDQPTQKEATELRKLGFHELAIQDCLHLEQRTKLDDYDDYHFFVINSLNPKSLEPLEIDIFQHEHYVVTFHYHPQPEIDHVWNLIIQDKTGQSFGSRFITYKIMDQVVDAFFPIAEHLEEQLTDLEIKPKANVRMQNLMNQVFHIRRNLLKLRHIIWPFRDLIYRVTQSEHLFGSEEERRYYMDVHDHLLRLSSMIESSREMTTDMRDNYMSINSNRMNSIMMTLTVITTIFMPLTFIAGIYGMNFTYMPETRWQYGYFMVLGLMGIIGLIMYYWFKRKGWFSKE